MLVDKITYCWRGTRVEAQDEGWVVFEIWLTKNGQKVWPPQPSGYYNQGYGFASGIEASQALEGLFIAAPGVEADTLEGFVSYTMLARGELIVDSQRFALPGGWQPPWELVDDPAASFSFPLRAEPAKPAWLPLAIAGGAVVVGGFLWGFSKILSPKKA